MCGKVGGGCQRRKEFCGLVSVKKNVVIESQLQTLEFDMTVWILCCCVQVGLLVNIVIFQLIAVLIRAFWISLQDCPLEASVCDSLANPISPVL